MNLFEQSDLEGSPKINSEDEFVLSQFQASKKESKISSQVFQCNTFLNDINDFNHQENNNNKVQKQIIKKEIEKENQIDKNKQLADQLNKQIQKLQQIQDVEKQQPNQINFQKEKKNVQDIKIEQPKEINKPQNQINFRKNLDQNMKKKMQLKKFEFKKPSIKKFQLPKKTNFNSNNNLNLKINMKKTPQINQEKPQKKILLNKKIQLPLEKIIEENPAIRNSLQKQGKDNKMQSQQQSYNNLSDCEDLFFKCIKQVCFLNRTQIFLKQKIKNLENNLSHLN